MKEVEKKKKKKKRDSAEKERGERKEKCLRCRGFFLHRERETHTHKSGKSEIKFLSASDLSFI